MSPEVFSPSIGGVVNVANSTTATAAVQLPPGADEVLLINTSFTAITYVTITPFSGATAPAGLTPTATNGIPILPYCPLRLHVGKGGKVIRTIASAADGNIVITPGNGV